MVDENSNRARPSHQGLSSTLSSRCFRWSSYLPFLLLSGVAKDISSFNKCLVSAYSVSSRCCVVRCVGEYLTKIVEKIDNKQDKLSNTVITTCRKKKGGGDSTIDELTREDVAEDGTFKLRGQI